MRQVRQLFMTVLVFSMLGLSALPVAAARPVPDKDPVAVGYGGAVATVDPVATEAGLSMLKRGGNAIDAAVAAAATLGLTEPYSAGIGGGGFMLVYVAAEDRVVVFDGREEAPEDPRFDADVFTENATGFFDAVNSGLSVGVPGTFATWVEALEAYGTMSLRRVLQPAVVASYRGFTVDQTFADQTADNRDRFRQITSTADTFLVDNEVPAVGSRFRNPDLGATYRLLQREGLEGFYEGPLAQEIADTVQNPPISELASEEWQPGYLTTQDLADYEILRPEPTMVDYRGYEVFGMPSPSSGGITVGEALNILENAELSEMATAQALHLYLEASAFAFADRNAYIGDDRYVYVPQQGLLSQEFADQRYALIDPAMAAEKPVPPGNPCPFDGSDSCIPDPGAVDGPPGESTTHLVTADKWGNVVSYTLTIEQTGGSAITVPGRGFILNNELTDFNFSGDSPNLPAPGKRPRSSMSPTIVLDDGEPFLAVGSPGGSTIITTVLQILIGRIDLGLSLPEAIAMPRATQRNTTDVGDEPEFRAAYGEALTELGHTFTDRGEIGTATGLEFLSDGSIVAAAEPSRRGGGDAAVLCPTGEGRRAGARCR